MSPSRRTVGLCALLALGLLVVPTALVAVAAVGLVAAVVVDAVDARRPLSVAREVPDRLARGVPAALRVRVEGAGARRVEVRQPRVPDLDVEPPLGDGGLDAVVIARRRGRHELPALAVRTTGGLGLVRRDRSHDGARVIEVLPDLPAARRLAGQVRARRFRDPGLRRRGPIGLGTNFDHIREYQPDDDIRHVNWVATARQGRPMTNRYREDTERDVVALLDCGRLMAAPVGPDLDSGSGAGSGGAGRDGPSSQCDRTRLDAAVDVAVALAAVADVVGDRCGLVAFDDEVRARVVPRRGSGDAVVRAVHALEPRPVDGDPDLAFRAVGTTKRALVVVLTDLVDEAAAGALLDALPYLVRRHAVVVASCLDPDLVADADDPGPIGVVARRVLASRDAAAARVRHRGARAVEAPADRLAAAVVAAYLDAKAAARL